MSDYGGKGRDKTGKKSRRGEAFNRKLELGFLHDQDAFLKRFVLAQVLGSPKGVKYFERYRGEGDSGSYGDGKPGSRGSRASKGDVYADTGKSLSRAKRSDGDDKPVGEEP